MPLSRDDAIALGLAIILREKKNSSRQRKRRWVKAWIARKEHSHTNLMNELQCKTVTTHNIINNDCNDMMPNNNSDENCMASLERGRDARVASQIARNVRDKFMTYFTGEGAIAYQENVL